MYKRHHPPPLKSWPTPCPTDLGWWCEILVGGGAGAVWGGGGGVRDSSSFRIPQLSCVTSHSNLRASSRYDPGWSPTAHPWPGRKRRSLADDSSPVGTLTPGQRLGHAREAEGQHSRGNLPSPRDV
jgi:hypothetical protein